MSVTFRKGDRVIVRTSRNTGVEGTVTWVSQSGLVQVHRDNHQPGGSWDYLPGELTKLVDAPVSLVGKRVKLTLGESVIVGTVSEERCSGVRVRPDGSSVGLNFATTVWTLEVLPEPIVLPTKQNALVEVGSKVYRFNGNKWFFAGNSSGGFLWPSSLKEDAERNPNNYRVIFPGE